MFQRVPEKCVVYVAADFERPSRIRSLEVADEVVREKKPERVVTQAGTTTLCWPSERRIFYLGPTRIGGQTLSLKSWLAGRDAHLEMLALSTKELQLEVYGRVGLKISGYLPLGMSKSEIVDLLFGSCLADRSILNQALGITTDDPYFQIAGQITDNVAFQLGATAMSIEEIHASLSQVPHLDCFLTRSIFGDDELRTFLHNLVTSDVFSFDIDISSSSVNPRDVKAFYSSAIEHAESVCDKFVKLLTSKPGQ